MKSYKIIFLFFIIIACEATHKNLHVESPVVSIFAIGDSTMANKPLENNNPERGWVQVLSNYFNQNIKIHNHAVNGRSSKSFKDLGHWDEVINQLKPNDYLLIQFGHNDAKDTDPVRYTNPQTAYRYNLIDYIDQAKRKGAKPILLSSIARRKFNENGVLLDAHGNYTLVARMVAEEQNIPFIDMQYLTEKLILKYGIEASKKLVLNFKPGEHPYFPDGKTDNTHLTELGAHEISKIFIEEIKKLDLDLAKYVK